METLLGIPKLTINPNRTPWPLQGKKKLPADLLTDVIWTTKTEFCSAKISVNLAVGVAA
jgi:hypothetical protein